MRPTAFLAFLLAALAPTAVATAGAGAPAAGPPPTGRCAAVVTWDDSPAECSAERPEHAGKASVSLHTYGLGLGEAMTLELFDADAPDSEALAGCTLTHGAAGPAYVGCSGIGEASADVVRLRCVVTPSPGTEAIAVGTCMAP